MTPEEIEQLRNRIRENRAAASAALAEARALANEAEEEARDLSENEQSEFDERMAEAENLRARADRLERLIDASSSGGTEDRSGRWRAPSAPADGARGDDSNEFRDFADFFRAALTQPNDPRIQDLYEERAGMSMGKGSAGGVAVPEKFRAELMQVDPEAALVRPRASIIPAGTPPDAAISMPALDQSADAGNMEGGVEVTWVEEGGEKKATDGKLRSVRYEPKELAAHIPVTDKLLRNWVAASAVLERLLRNAIMAAEDRRFISGPGVGSPLGFLASEACLAVNRTDANEITYDDVVEMDARAFGNNLVWAVARRSLPQLRKLRDEDGRYIWQPNVAGSGPGTLLGHPVIISNRVPSLGQVGDISLVDLSYYNVKDGSGPFIEAGWAGNDFVNNKQRVKVFTNVDGGPWLHKPLKLDNGDIASPFVKLDVPS